MSSIWPTVALSSTYYLIVRWQICPLCTLVWARFKVVFLFLYHGQKKQVHFFVTSIMAKNKTSQIVIILCFIARHIGPHMMKDREPYDLKSVMLAYNLLQTLFNSWLFCSVSSLVITVKNSWPPTEDWATMVNKNTKLSFVYCSSICLFCSEGTSQKKCSFNLDFVHKGRFQSKPKILGHFLWTKFSGLLVERGGMGGFDKIQNFWDTFCQNIGWITMQKSVPKVPKVLTFGKVSQKIQKSGGRSDLFWTKSELKLNFYFESVPNWTV